MKNVMALKTTDAVDAHQSIEVEFVDQSSQAEAVWNDVSNTDFNVEEAMQVVDQLQVEADANYHNYELVGRKAVINLMGRTYMVWKAAKDSKCFESFCGNLTQKLKDKNITVKSVSKKASLLIRYVFNNISDKQVHVYSLALEAAYENNLHAETDFYSMIKNTAGGFEGIRSKAAGGSDKNGDTTIAFSKCSNEATIKTIDGLSWGDGEQFTVLIAIRNEDGTANLKKSWLTEADNNHVLRRFFINKKKEENPDKKAKSSKNIEQKQILKCMEAILAEHRIKLDSVSTQVDMIKQNGGFDAHLEAQVSIEKALIDAIEGDIKAAKQLMKA